MVLERLSALAVRARPSRPESDSPPRRRPWWPSRAVRLRVWRVTAVIAVGLIGGIIGMMLGGRVQTPVGPTDVGMSLRPSLNGGTTVQIPPLGALHLDSHWGPIRLEARVVELHADEARRLIESQTALDQVTDQIADDVRSGVMALALQAAAFTLVFGFMAGLLVFRSWRRALFSMAAATVALAVSALLAFATFSPQSIAEPQYTGLLANAPQVVGDARSIVERFSAYRAQLARLVGNVSRLYAATSTLPAYEPDPSTIRVIFVSDIHLNPAAFDVIKSVSGQFQADLVIDSGDLADHGSRLEDRFSDAIEAMRIPYIFVRGNHDSADTARAVARQKNAHVLDGASMEIEGLRIWGVGDPRFTPDKTTRDDDVTSAQLKALGLQQAQTFRARTTGATPDIVVVHDPGQGAAFSGIAPLVLSGHAHQRSTTLTPTGTRLFVQGSTGGAGLRGLEGEQPTPIELSVLYFNRLTHRLQGWDDLRLGGLGLTSVQIERHLEPQPNRLISPPTTSPSPTTTPPSGWPSLPPSDWPTTTPTPPTPPPSTSSPPPTDSPPPPD